MVLSPSRKDILGPPPRDVTDLANIVRHQGSYLRQLNPGMLGGRFATPRPVPGGATTLVGDDGGGGDSAAVIGEDGDRHVCFGVGFQRFQLSYIPIEDTVHLHWHASANSAGVEWKRGDHWDINDTGLISIYPFARGGQSWPKIGSVFSAQYLHLDGEDEVAAPEVYLDSFEMSAWDGSQTLNTGLILADGQDYRLVVHGNYSMDGPFAPIPEFPPIGNWNNPSTGFDQPQYDSMVVWRVAPSQWVFNHTGPWGTDNPLKWRRSASESFAAWPPYTPEFYYSGGWPMGDPAGYSSDIVTGVGEELRFEFVVGGPGADNSGSLTVDVYEA